MKTLRILGRLLLTAMLLTCIAFSSRASHTQGSDLTYQAIGPNMYQVTLKIYRDCTGIAAPTSATLNIKSPNCNNGRSIPMTKLGTNTIGNLYCPQLGAPVCSSTGKPNYEEVKFTAILTFSAAEQTCTDWYLSWSECCRPDLANLANASGVALYSEAFIKLGLVDGNNQPKPNSSPEFTPQNVPIPLVCYLQQTRYSLNASETDGDSLLYELIQPESAFNTPIAYGPNPLGGQNNLLLSNPSPKPPYGTDPWTTQFAKVTTPFQANFTPGFPMPSVVVNWNGAPTIPQPLAPIVPLIWEATPGFRLNPATGELIFTPAYYVPSAPNLGKNKYAVVVKISEFRKINGSWVKVGHIRRDIMFIVEDCKTSVLPTTSVPTIPVKYQASYNDTIFTVQSCNTTRLRLKFIDPNKNNITVSYIQNQINKLPEGSIAVIGQGNDSVTVEIMITPGIADQGKKYNFELKVENDACPIKSSQTQVYTIQVDKKDLATVSGIRNRTICLGSPSPIDIVLQRPDSLLMQPATYQYTWSLVDPGQAATAGLKAADKNQKNIVVTPTAIGTYKYLLTVIPMSTNGITAGCMDTALVTVKVEDVPRPDRITLRDPKTNLEISEIRFGRSGQLEVVVPNAGNGFTYSWSPGKFLSDSTVKNPIASPLKTTVYTVKVTSANGKCFGEFKQEIKVSPFELPNIITPNTDGKNDAFKALGIPANTSFQVFNRWGVKVKEFQDYKNDFSGEGLSDGTYYYILKEPGNGPAYKGWFEISR